ncbi:MAG: PfkB family carbohydrate kinase, partial [Candidatus Rokuibacteriota bacterium]
FEAFPVEAVDTTGAGDAFNGALAVGLAAGGSVDQIIPLASAARAPSSSPSGSRGRSCTTAPPRCTSRPSR